MAHFIEKTLCSSDWVLIITAKAMSVLPNNDFFDIDKQKDCSFLKNHLRQWFKFISVNSFPFLKKMFFNTT